MSRTAGVVGLGTMGGAIAGHLAAAGWQVFGADPDEGRRAAALANGVLLRDDARAVAKDAHIVLLSLPSAAAALQVARQIADAGVPRRLVLEASTLGLSDKLAIAAVLEEAGHAAVDCPLSGTGAQARTKDLVAYVSGAPADVAAAMPLFADFARDAQDVGAYGNGAKLKLVANLLVAIHNVAAAEALVLGMKAGLEPVRLIQLLQSGAGASRMLEMRGPMMVDGRYEPATMRLDLWEKDMALIAAFAGDLDSPTPLFGATRPLYARALSELGAGHDTAAVCAILEDMAGIRSGGLQAGEP